MRDDILMAEEIGRLKAEANKNYEQIQAKKQEIYDLEQDIKKAKRIAWIKNSWIILLITAVLCCAGYPFIKWIFSSNHPLYCQIIQKNKDCKNGYIIEEHNQGSYYLTPHTKVCSNKFAVQGVIDWGSNIDFGEFESQEEAIQHAIKNNCKIGK